MSTPHLSHLLPWQDLIELLRKHDATAVALPIGKQCGKIHAKTKAIQKIVERRSYISEESICVDDGCSDEVLTDLQEFGKKQAHTLPVEIVRPYPRKSKRLNSSDDKRRFRRFAEAFSTTIRTFAEQENAKLSLRVIHKAKEIATKDYVKKCEQAFHNNKESYYAGNRELDPVYALMSESTGENDLAVLLYLDQKGDLDIRGALAEYFGGQAVGHGMRYLVYHLMTFYLRANAAAAADQLTDADCCDMLLLTQSWVMQDHDFYTFVPAWRELLVNNLAVDSHGEPVYNWQATFGVLKKIFRFFVVYELLIQRGYGYGYEQNFSSSVELALNVAGTFGIKWDNVIDYSNYVWK